MLLAYLDLLIIKIGSSAQELLNGSGEDPSALDKPNKLIEDYGNGFMNIGKKIFVFILVIGIILAAIGFIWHRNNQQKIAENKSGFGWVIVGGIIGFGAVSLVLLLETIGTGLFN